MCFVIEYGEAKCNSPSIEGDNITIDWSFIDIVKQKYNTNTPYKDLDGKEHIKQYNVVLY